MTSIIAQYFLNHRLDLDEIEWQVTQIARAGYHGLYAHARQGLLTPYMSEAWWQAIGKILEVCRREGLEFWIWDEDYFPSGTAGGRIVWEDPGLLARSLEFSVADVHGEGPFEVDFAPGSLLRTFALRRRPDGSLDQPEDVTPFCGTRRQAWTPRQVLHRAYSPLVNMVGPPHWRCSYEDNRFALMWTPSQPGEYVIVAAVVQTGRGPWPDILRPESTTRFIEMTHEEYLRRYPDEFGRLITGAFTDEPSPGGIHYPWTERFPAEFEADHGYSILDHLPHLALDVDERSPAVRHHYRQTQHRLQRTYVDQIAEWCERQGIASTGHLTRTEWLSLVAAWWPNELRFYQPMHIPCADPLGAASSWRDAAAYHTGLKVVSSAAHLFGRAQAGSDALAVVGDEATIRDLKYILDYQMALGINYFAVHGLAYSLDGPRKDEVPPSLFYQHTEWKHMRRLWSHVAATCESLTGGRHVCEVAVLYPSTSLGCQTRPETAWECLPDEALIHGLVERLLSHQVDFDFVDETTLQEAMTEEGSLTTPEAYQTIILPHVRFIERETARRLLRFARRGGRVLVVGPVPEAIGASLEEPLSQWADESVERVENLTDETLASLPHVAVGGQGARDVFVLRRCKDGRTTTFLFNRAGDAFEGEVEGRPAWIAPRGSALLRDGEDAAHPLAATEAVGDLSSGWTVTFEPNHVPLGFWHAQHGDAPPMGRTFSGGAGFDLMQRQADPLGPGDGAALYQCRFMLTGEVSDARLVLEDSTVGGDWELYVNGVLIEGWQRAVVFDCRNMQAPVGHALVGGSTPTLNVITVRTWGPGRGLSEVPYLYGSFTCQFRHGHLSLPYLRGAAREVRLEALQPWAVIGYPTFSGSAVYRKQMAVPQAGEYLLDLGRVEDVAAVSLDGQRPQVLAWPPYVCALGRLAPGAHGLSVEITNAPGNRNRASGLPSGLLGPVRLLRRR
jgi:hypothetical protein